MDVPSTIHVDGRVRVLEWLGRDQPYTIWGGNTVYYFAKTGGEAMIRADQAKEQMKKGQ